MTFGGFQSSWGKLFKYLPIKPWYLVAVCIFEIGSLICAVSKDPTALIVGRAIAGVGGAGLIVGTFTLAAMITTREKRPQVNGYLGATYGVAAVLGPIIGGAFTDRVSWRWVSSPESVDAIADDYVVFLHQFAHRRSSARMYRYFLRNTNERSASTRGMERDLATT